MKTNLLGLAVAAATLTSFAAFADDWDDDDGVSVSIGWAHPSHADDMPCTCGTHEAAPVEAQDNGRYELRDTQKWIPARYEQVVVQQCVEKRHHGHRNHWKSQRCFPVTQTRTVPGYYENVQEWVWVPTYPQHPQYSTVPSHNPPRAQARVGFRFGVRTH